MKKILVISWFFPPVNSSEGLVTYKLINNSKYEYDVFTQHNNSLWSYSNDDNLDLNKNINCIYSTANNLTNFVDDAYEYYLANSSKYDIVMTRSMPEESHIIGLKIKMFNPNIYWIASFGDPIGRNPFTLKSIKSDCYNSLKNRYVRNFTLKEIVSIKRILNSFKEKIKYTKNYNLFVKNKNRLEHKILKNADSIICNNSYEMNYLCKNNGIKDNNKFLILPHSYDLKLYTGNAVKNDKIVFRYIGHLDNIRTPRMLFEAIKLLKNKDANISSRVVFEFYGNLNQLDKDYVKNNGLEDVIIINSSVKYVESLRLMKESDWLIHIDANIYDLLNENIFFAAKLADYIGYGKNILGITMLDGISADILRDINALTLTYSVSNIYTYLYLIIYTDFKCKINDKKRNKYDAVEVAKLFDNFISDILRR